MKPLLILVTITLGTSRLSAQTDSIPLTKDNLSCTYIIEKVWKDPRSAYKREALGEVNFFQIENGVVSSAVRTAAHKYAIQGTLDSISVIMDGEGSYKLMIYLTTLNPSKADKTEYVFDITQENETIVIHGSPRRKLDDYYFLVHVATDEELYKIQKYFAENTPKY